MTALLSDLDRGVYVEPTRQSLGDYLQQDWPPAITTAVRPSTYDSYSRVLRLHVTALPIGRSPLRYIDGPKLNALWHLLATTGMRRGEALGLHSDDVDLDAGRLSIKRTLVQVANYTKDGTEPPVPSPPAPPESESSPAGSR